MAFVLLIDGIALNEESYISKLKLAYTFNLHFPSTENEFLLFE